MFWRKEVIISSNSQTLPLHSRSVLGSALLMSLGAAVGQGFARFGYALLLTAMQTSLGWSYAQAGLVNSANALGYLIGSLAVGPAVARWGAARVTRVSLLAVSCSLITTGLSDHLAVLFCSRVVSGFGAALLYIAGVSVVLALDASPRSDLAVGVYYGGPGIGIAISGLFVPIMLASLGWSWRAAWIALGALGILTQLVVEIPLRSLRRAAPTSTFARSGRLFVARDYLMLWSAMVAYTLFGLGYIGYMTFVVAFLRSINVAPTLVQGFWVVLGLCAICSGFTWRPVIRRLRPHQALSLILVTLAIATALPVVIRQNWSFLLSAVLFGSSFLAVVTIVTIQVRLLLPEARWTAVVGNATALFALGQLLGPTLTGIVADVRGGLALGLLGSAAILGLSALIALGGRQAFHP